MEHFSGNIKLLFKFVFQKPFSTIVHKRKETHFTEFFCCPKSWKLKVVNKISVKVKYCRNYCTPARISNLKYIAFPPFTLRKILARHSYQAIQKANPTYWACSSLVSMKGVLTFGEKTREKLVKKKRSLYSVSYYIITGGAGGVGRNIYWSNLSTLFFFFFMTCCYKEKSYFVFTLERERERS